MKYILLFAAIGSIIFLSFACSQQIHTGVVLRQGIRIANKRVMVLPFDNPWENETLGGFIADCFYDAFARQDRYLLPSQDCRKEILKDETRLKTLMEENKIDAVLMGKITDYRLENFVPVVGFQIRLWNPARKRNEWLLTKVYKWDSNNTRNFMLKAEPDLAGEYGNLRYDQAAFTKHMIYAIVTTMPEDW
ncbi:MAG: hypothetical protein J7K51_00855 [Thermotogae bacterium]|nr:hypothetical protein [Thermotogota bacterium]